MPIADDNLDRRRRARPFIIAILCLWCAAAANGHPADRSGRASQAATAPNPNIVENDEIRVLITPGWSVTENSAEPLVKLGPHVQVAKDGYTLTLAYHASPPPGGADTRFTQIFAMPWLSPSQTLGCSYYLRRKQQVITEMLLFVNLRLEASDSGMSKACGVPPEAGSRWFAGFFTNATGGFFLRSRGAGCGEKAYILTSDAKSPSELPEPDDAKLSEIIAEAGRMVAAIQYKRCPLAPAPDLLRH